MAHCTFWWFPNAIGSIPVARGSNVPPCPAFSASNSAGFCPGRVDVIPKACQTTPTMNGCPRFCSRLQSNSFTVSRRKPGPRGVGRALNRINRALKSGPGFRRMTKFGESEPCHFSLCLRSLATLGLAKRSSISAHIPTQYRCELISGIYFTSMRGRHQPAKYFCSDQAPPIPTC